MEELSRREIIANLHRMKWPKSNTKKVCKGCEWGNKINNVCAQPRCMKEAAKCVNTTKS